jgi:tripartite-type tricarboxylate transporter receptor subunit TctC
MRPEARHILAAVAPVVLLLALLPASVAADPVEDFYKGKQIRIITGANAGDGYDLWSRFLGRHIGRHIPGHPSIIVQNMPGAGTLVAANHIFNLAARDGTIIGSFSRSLPSQALLNRPNIRFDPRQFGWLGSPETINRVCAVGAAAKAKSIDDVFTQEVLVGGMGASMVPTYVPTLLNKLVGTKFRVVEGYGGTNAIFLAIERREVDGICMASSTLLGPRVDLIESGALKVLFNMEAKTMAALPGVPTMFARLKSEKDRQIVSFINSALEFGRPFTAPPGVPPERLAALQAALRATVEDPEFLAEAKQLKFQITYTSPDELHAITERMYATPRAIIDEAAAMMPSE